MAEIGKGEIVDQGAVKEVLDLKGAILEAADALRMFIKRGKN